METQLPKGRLDFLLLCIRDCAFGWDLEGNLNLQTWGCHEPGRDLRVEVHRLLWGGTCPRHRSVLGPGLLTQPWQLGVNCASYLRSSVQAARRFPLRRTRTASALTQPLRRENRSSAPSAIFQGYSGCNVPGCTSRVAEWLNMSGRQRKISRMQPVPYPRPLSIGAPSALTGVPLDVHPAHA